MKYGKADKFEKLSGYADFIYVPLSPFVDVRGNYELANKEYCVFPIFYSFKNNERTNTNIININAEALNDTDLA